MPTTLLKRVTSPNVYRVKDPITGKLSTIPITADTLKRWASTGAKMLANGIRIPVPFAHVDDQGKMPHPITLSDSNPIDAFTRQPIGWRADLNAGYVSKVFYSPDGSPESFPEGVTPPSDYTPQGEGFYAAIDAEGDPTDPRTPAWKLLNSVKETSICVRDKYTDGLGNEYTEAPIHVAACTHARETGQPPFVALAPPPLPSPENNLQASISSALHPSLPSPSLSMSDSPYLLITMSEAVSNPSSPAVNPSPLGAAPGNPAQQPQDLLQQVLALLRVQAIDLPEDTTPANLLERLVICLRQKSADKAQSDQENAPSQPPPGSEAKPPSIAMAETTLNTPTTPSADPGANPPSDKAALILMGQVVNAKKQSLLARIEKLVSLGKVGREYANTNLIPKLTTLSFSLDQMNDAGEFPKSSVEETIEAIESATATKPGLTTMSDNSGIVPEGTEVPEVPEWGTESGGAGSDEPAAEVVDDILECSTSF